MRSSYHGAHWWADSTISGQFDAHGFEGQRIMCVPALDLVVVRLGRTHTDLAPGSTHTSGDLNALRLS